MATTSAPRVKPQNGPVYRNGHGNGPGNGNGHGNGNGNGNGNGYFSVQSASAKEQLYEVLHVFFKRWRMIVGLFVAVVLPSLLITLSRGANYTATGKVLIVSDRAQMTIQPTEVESLNLIKLNEAIVNSEVHIIRSREVLQDVVRGLRMARMGGDVVAVANASGESESIADRALRVGRRLKVTPVRNSNVIEIKFSSGDPKQATLVVNRLIDEYLVHHARVHAQKDLSNFYDKQSRDLAENLRQAEKNLREYLNREGVVDPAAEVNAAVVAVSQTEGALRTRRTSIAAAEEKLRVIREQLNEQPSVIKRAQYHEVNPVVRQLREHVIDREIDRVALLRKYTDKHRTVRDNAEEIDELQARLQVANQDEPTIVTQEVFAANPVYETRLSRLLELESRLRADRARQLALEEELAVGRRRLVLLKEKALAFESYDQEVKRHRASQELFEKRAAEARIGEAMNREKLVNVQIVQRPGLPLEPIDNRRATVLLALISGLAVSLGGAFGLEYLNRTLRFERDVERYLGLPVLAAIPDANGS
jgi:uncharacterized protein involved in exopolysaccharide biosynthesis